MKLDASQGWSTYVILAVIRILKSRYSQYQNHIGIGDLRCKEYKDGINLSNDGASK